MCIFEVVQLDFILEFDIGYSGHELYLWLGWIHEFPVSGISAEVDTVC